MLWGSMAEKAILDALEHARVESLTAYRSEMDRRWDYYLGDQDGHLLNAMALVFPKTYRKIGKVAFSKFTRKVIDDTAQVYWQRPKRELLGADGKALEPKNEKAREWARLTSKGRLDTICRTMNRQTRLFRTMFLWVVPDEERDLLDWRPIPPQGMYIVQSPEHPGDISRAELVIFPLDRRTVTTAVGYEDSVEYAAFTPHEWCRFKGGVTDEAGVEVKQFTHPPTPYPEPLQGWIPLVACHDEYANGELLLDFNDGRAVKSPVIEANEKINLALTDICNLVRKQAAGQLVWTSTSKVPSEIVVSPETIIWNKDTAGNVGYISPGAQIEACKQFIEWLLMSYSNLEQLSPQTFATERRDLSGYAMMLENLSLVRFVSEQQEHYAESFDVDVFEMSRRVANAYLSTNLPDDLEQAVHHEPLDYPASEQEHWQTVSAKIDKGVVSHIDAIMEENSDFDEDEAEAKLDKNLESKKKVDEAKQPPGMQFNFQRKPKPGEEPEKGKRPPFAPGDNK